MIYLKLMLLIVNKTNHNKKDNKLNHKVSLIMFTQDPHKILLSIIKQINKLDNNNKMFHCISLTIVIKKKDKRLSYNKQGLLLHLKRISMEHNFNN